VRHHYDVVIIGSGAGGGTLARALAGGAASVLLLERGDFLPREDENWDPKAVWVDRRYHATERWLDGSGREFSPHMHYCVGGNTKFWGSALFRLRREDFGELEHEGGLSPAWPIDYDALAPYYERAERLYQVHGEAGIDPTEPKREPYPYAPVPHAPAMAKTVAQLRQQGLHPFPLPLGLIRPGESEGCTLCSTCNSFPCRLGAKSDAETCGVGPAKEHSNVTLWTHSRAERLITDPSGRKLEAVDVARHGETVRVTASRFVVSCGAVNSAALLLRSAGDAHPNGLANSSGLLGRNYMAHLPTNLEAFDPFQKNSTVFQKTVAINDFYLRGPDTRFPLGNIQSQGRSYPAMGHSVVPWMPTWIFDAWMGRAVDWLAMTEDLPHPDNRVTLTPGGQIHLEYRANNLMAHRRLVKQAKHMLHGLGLRLVASYTHDRRNTTHQCGTLCFGTDPTRSVLDPYCRAHDVENLFVVDGSFFPSSGAVNPGLTIVAQALRVADHLVETL
jgi:choline dehydrogenase-like flavoprotein